MKKIYLLFYFTFCILHTSFSQGGTWTWISGDSTFNSPGVYGTQGVPSVNNHPPALFGTSEWKDKQGNFWIYGGYHAYFYSSDLWEYNPITNEWTWVKGSGLSDQQPDYGTKGIANPSNTPGLRDNMAATWVDTSGTLWLFGGLGINLNEELNDLWKYDINTNDWTWVKGDNVGDAVGVSGTQGIPDSLNNPGSRCQTASAWIDSLNNLWVFGGYGIDSTLNYGSLSDMWKYDISNSEWTWMKGTVLANAAAVYGIKGISNTNNDPGARHTVTKWKDAQGNFWLIGGLNSYSFTCYNDVWKYDLKINEWTWMSGTNVADDIGNYESNCIFDTINLPYSRFHESSATDYCNRFWLFGGEDFEIQSTDFNDLWVFDPEQLKWNWINGPKPTIVKSNYGNIGVSSPSNLPSGRQGAVAWWGNDNKFYMFGGWQGSTTNTYSDLWVFNPDTNCVPVCAAPVIPSPVASFQVSQASICANGCTNFTDLSANATSWQWSFSGAMDSTSSAQNPQNICYSKAGIYNVTLIASNAAGSDTVTFSNYITVNAAPPTPVITQSHDTLFCSTNPSYTSYQWYLDSTMITSATDTFFVISESGNYNVEVTNANNCSAAVGINIVYGIQNYVSDNTISIYPNPATDELLIDGSWKMEDGSLKLTIINVLGEVIYTETVNRKQETVNCKSFPAGVYFVQVANESGSWVGKFIKE